MINFNYNGIKNTLASFNLLSISIERKAEKVEHPSNTELIKLEPTVSKEYRDHKTTLGGWETDLIAKLNDNLIAYFFIQKERESSDWNLVAPVLLETTTGRIIQYGLGYFALQGCGGGLNNTNSVLYYLNKLQERGYKVHLVPKVVDTNLLRSFEYTDSGTTLENLLKNSIDLINYRKGKFEWIHKQYQQLVDKYKLNSDKIS